MADNLSRRENYLDVFDRKRRAAAIAERLKTVASYLVPLTQDEADQQLMIDWDLTSCATYRFGVNLDPDVMKDPAVRDHWLDIALDDGEYFGDYFEFGRRPYWIIDNGERIGTTGFWVRDMGHEITLELLSVYIHPSFRRQGWASRVIRCIRDVAFDVGVERVLVSCDWGNQDALRFYLAQGFWVQSWKREIRFSMRKAEPSLRMTTAGTRATFLVGDRIVGIAENQGDRLGWQLGDGVDKDLKWSLEATAPVYLALMDWPIIRNDQEWQAQVHSGVTDCGDFENLALRIRRFERHLRSKGWKVPAPNPSFATLPKLVAVDRRADRFQVTTSDGRTYPLPFDVLNPMPTKKDPVAAVDIISGGEELRYRLRSGKESVDEIEYILGLNQSPEHLQEMREFWRKQRG